MMRRICGMLVSLCLLAGLLPCGAEAAARTVGTEIAAEEITEFYYIYDWIGYNATYRQYHFFTENGKHMFFHEARGTENDYGLNTEEDVISRGVKELSEEEWAAFFELLQDGTVTAPDGEVLDGDSGPWMHLYWAGDENIYREFSFASFGRLTAFEEFCECLAGESRPGANLVSCEYSVYGGMENGHFRWTAELKESGEDAVLTVEENGEKQEYPLSGEDLKTLEDFLAELHPETWAALPEREYFALDAPERRIVLVYGDGTEYAVDSTRETGGPVFRELEDLLGGFRVR